MNISYWRDKKLAQKIIPFPRWNDLNIGITAEGRTRKPVSIHQT